MSRRTVSWSNFSKDLCFLFILGLWQKFLSLSLLSWYFSRGSLNWNLHFLRNISKKKKNYFRDNLCFSIQSFFRHCAKSFSRSSVTIPRCYQNWKLRVHRNSLREKILFGTVCVLLFYLFSRLEQKVLAVLRYISGGFTKAAFYVSREIFFDEKKTLKFFFVFLDLQSKNSVCSSEDLWWHSHNCVLSIGTVWMKVFLKSFCFLFIILTMSETFFHKSKFCRRVCQNWIYVSLRTFCILMMSFCFRSKMPFYLSRTFTETFPP